MDIEIVRECARQNRFYESRHAKNEREADQLTLADVTTALSSGHILEEYPDTGRGESRLIIGFSGAVPIHIVCARSHRSPDQIVIVTVYIPRLPKFIDPWTRNRT